MYRGGGAARGEKDGAAGHGGKEEGGGEVPAPAPCDRHCDLGVGTALLQAWRRGDA